MKLYLLRACALALVIGCSANSAHQVASVPTATTNRSTDRDAEITTMVDDLISMLDRISTTVDGMDCAEAAAAISAELDRNQSWLDRTYAMTGEDSRRSRALLARDDYRERYDAASAGLFGVAAMCDQPEIDAVFGRLALGNYFASDDGEDVASADAEDAAPPETDAALDQVVRDAVTMMQRLARDVDGVSCASAASALDAALPDYEGLFARMGAMSPGDQDRAEELMTTSGYEDQMMDAVKIVVAASERCAGTEMDAAMQRLQAAVDGS
jgi:hypothetical protein